MEGLAEIGPKPQKMVGAKSPDDPHRAAQVFEHKDLIVGGHIALFAVEHDRERLRMVPERLGQVPHRAAAVSILGIFAQTDKSDYSSSPAAVPGAGVR